MTFNVGKSYPSAVKYRRYRVKMKFRVQDTDCLLVYPDNLSTKYGRTSQFYPAIIEGDGTATVLKECGFTTIYDEEEV